MLLSQLSALSGMGVDVMAEIADKSPFVRRVEFREDPTDYSYYPTDAQSQPAFRALGGSYGPDAENPTKQNGTQAFLGGEFTLDKSYKVDAEKGMLNLDLYVRRLYMQRAKSMAEGIDKQTFIGDGSSNSLEGFVTLLDGSANVTGFSSTMVVDAAAGGGLDVTSDTKWSTFLELIDNVLYDVPGANMIACNRTLASKLSTIARNRHALTYDLDEFGYRAGLFNNVPIVPLADGAIANNEAAADAGTDTTSLYIFRWEEVNGVSLVSNNGLEFKEFDELEASVNSKARLELRYNIAIESPDALRRIRYIKAQ